MPSVFISYRHGDEVGHARWLRTELRQRLQSEHVFLDDEVQPGEDFVARYEKAIESSGVVLAVVGERWGESRGGKTPHVYAEIRKAIRCGVAIIPVVVEGSRMPDEAALPPDLTPFARINAFKLRDDRDVAELANLIQRLLSTVRKKATDESARQALAARVDQLSPLDRGHLLFPQNFDRNTLRAPPMSPADEKFVRQVDKEWAKIQKRQARKRSGGLGGLRRKRT
jgi:hypothetical protein